MAESGKKIITVNILRSGPEGQEEGFFQSYSVDTDEAMTVQALLRYIYKNLDQSIAFRNYSCYMGVCSCCLVKVDGKTVKACETSITPGSNIIIEPAGPGPENVIRDLVSYIR